MESLRVYIQVDHSAFIRRRGIIVMIGLIMVLCIILTHLYKLWRLMNLLQIIDSVLGSASPKDISIATDPTMYQVETTNHNVYSGYIIFQDEVMIKFRTTSLKPIKILKSNIVRVTVITRQYATANVGWPSGFFILLQCCCYWFFRLCGS